MCAVLVTHGELSIAQLRAAAARALDAKQTRRILAIAMVLEGHSRQLAAAACGMDRQTLRDWVHRYNEAGVAGLSDHRAPGRQPYLSAAQLREVAQWVTDGPDPQTDRVVRWRCADLRDRIAARFDVHLHERTIGKTLKKPVPKATPSVMWSRPPLSAISMWATASLTPRPPHAWLSALSHDWRHA